MATVLERIPRLLAKLNSNSHSFYPPDQRDQAYTRSYRVIRLAVGVIGIVLPAFLIAMEAVFLKGSVGVRGSLSAYYHSSVKDVFVGSLCVIGLLLITYMAGERRSWDFWVSLTAGAALLGVVFFPTMRPGLGAGAVLCGSNPQPAGCSSVEQALGEHTTALIHAGFAVTFIVCLAVMSFLFALSEVLPPIARAGAPGRPRLHSARLFAFYGACGGVILAAGAWAFWGAAIGGLTALYIGEVVSVVTFACCWLLASFERTAPYRYRTA